MLQIAWFRVPRPTTATVCPRMPLCSNPRQFPCINHFNHNTEVPCSLLQYDTTHYDTRPLPEYCKKNMIPNTLQKTIAKSVMR